MTEFAGSRGSNQTPGIAVLRGLFLGEQAITTACTFDPVASDEPKPVNGQGQAVVRNAALVDQPAVSDAARGSEPQSMEDASADRLARGAVWCMAAVAVAAFAMAVWR